MTVKDGIHDLEYVFLLYCMFNHFMIKLGKVSLGTKKKMIIRTMLEECECIKKDEGISSVLVVSELITAKNKFVVYLGKLIALIAQRGTEIVSLKVELLMVFLGPNEGLSFMTSLQEENSQLKAEVVTLKDQVGVLT